jgi:hypothetical protein
MKTIKKVLLVEGNPNDARLPRETFNESGSLDVGSACISKAGRHLDNDLRPTKVELFQGAPGR